MKVVGVNFGDGNKVNFFDVNDCVLDLGIDVIVDTDKGLQFGTVVSFVNSEDISDKIDYKKVVRVSTKNDYKQHLNNLKDAKKAILKCNELISLYKLNMHIVDAVYTFAREQLIFRFVADERVDFRQLARDLGTIFKTRIELRQIGIRDKAREIGGIGPCGRALCCSKFLNEFDSVFISMAKNQMLSLNPTKINGVCGRLLCCLKYENDNYTEYRKGLPEIGKKAIINGCEGKVISVDIFKRRFRIITSDNEILESDEVSESKE